MITQSLLALDAGKRKVYGAIYNSHSVLVAIRAFDPEVCVDCIPIDRVVLEKVNINRNTPNWQNTLDCGLSGERVAGRMRAPIKCYEPSQWKGGIKKPLHHLFAWRVLTEPERAIFPTETIEIIKQACATLAATGEVKNYSFDNHNFLDAVTLGLFELGRIGRGGQKAR